MNQKLIKEVSTSSAKDQVKNLYFVMTCIAACTCIIRADFNFAFGLLGYYMIKTTNPKKMDRAASTVSKLPNSKSNLAPGHNCAPNRYGYHLVHDHEVGVVKQTLEQ